LLASDPGWRRRLVILEKRTHPRHKLCGGGLTALALRNLKRLGLTLDIPHVRVEKVNFTYGSHQVELPGHPAIVVTRRSEFDAWLAARAVDRGLELIQSCAVHNLSRTAGGIRLDTEAGPLMARAIVGADGSRGLVRRWIGARETPPRVARLLEFVTPAKGDELEHRKQVARFDFSAVRDQLQGYYWDFPSVVRGEPHMNRGVYDGRVVPARQRAHLPDLLTRQSAARGVPAERIRLEGHPIHWFSPSNQFAAERVLLVGDAAGAEPLFGEGIGIALGQGEVAAAALTDAFGRQDYRFAGYRRRLLVSSVGRYLLFRWAVAAMVYRFSGSELFMRSLWGVAQVLTDLIGSLPRVDGVLADPATRSQPG
jgi:flavin-dependent dehydrogenase